MKTLLFFLISATTLAQEVPIRLAWDDDQTDIIEYRLKVGTVPGVYPTIHKSNIKNFAFPVDRNTIYYAIVTAVDYLGNESDPSVELTFTARPRPPKNLRKVPN